VVTAVGPHPEALTIEIPTAADACAGARSAGPEVGSAGELAGVVVYLDGVSSGKPWPVEPPEHRIIDQRGCTYLPRYLALPIGETLLFRNSDPLPHNVRVESGYDIVLNVAQPGAGVVDSMPLAKPGALTVVCDYHPWMFASVYVASNPYYTVTGKDGAFSLDGVPAGTYTVVAWYPDPVPRPLLDDAGHLVRYTYGKPYVVTSKVTVTSGAVTQVPIALEWRRGGQS